MARTNSNILLKGVSGKIGDQLVVKQYAGKTVISAMPNMSHVKPSKLQKQKRGVFAEAVKFAQSVIRDPVKKKAYAKKVKAGQAVYHYALQQYLKKAGK